MREVELVEHRRIDGLHVFFNTLEYRTPHCHREIELLLVLEGRLAIPGAAQEAAPGDMALFGANQTHELRALAAPSSACRPRPSCWSARCPRYAG